MYATEDGFTPLARSPFRWRVSVPLSVIALGAGYLLLTLIPLSPRLSALLPSRTQLADEAAKLPTAASLAIAGVGGVALALVLARLVRGVERRPYASIAPVLAVLFGLLHLSLRVELPLPGFPSTHVSGFVIALALLGGALVARASWGARLLGWTLVLVPPALVVTLVANAHGYRSLAALNALDPAVRVSLGLLAGSALLLGVAGVFARWVLQKWGHGSSALGESWSDWSSPSAPPPTATAEAPVWGSQPAPEAGADAMRSTMLGWGAPGTSPADAASAYDGSQSGYGYAQPGASNAGYAYPQTSGADPNYAYPQTSGADPNYAYPQTNGADPNYAYPQTNGADPNYAYPQTNGADPNYAYPQTSGSEAGYAYPSGTENGYAYPQTSGAYANPQANTYDASAGQGAYAGYSGAQAGYGDGDPQAGAYQAAPQQGYAYGTAQPASYEGAAQPGYAYGGGASSETYGTAMGYGAAGAVSQPGYASAPAQPSQPVYRGSTDVAVRRRGHTVRRRRGLGRSLPLAVAVVAAALGAYYLVHGLNLRSGGAATSGPATPPPPGMPVVEQLSEPLGGRSQPAAAASETKGSRRRHRHERGHAREAKAAAREASAASKSVSDTAEKSAASANSKNATHAADKNAERGSDKSAAHSATSAATTGTTSTRGSADTRQGRSAAKGRADADRAGAQPSSEPMPSWGANSSGARSSSTSAAPRTSSTTTTARTSSTSTSTATRPTSTSTASRPAPAARSSSTNHGAAAASWGAMKVDEPDDTPAPRSSSASTTRPSTGSSSSSAAARPSSSSRTVDRQDSEASTSSAPTRPDAANTGSSASSTSARSTLGRGPDKPAAAEPPAPSKPAAPAKPLTMDQLLDRVAPSRKAPPPKNQADRELDELLEKSLKPKGK